MRRISLILVATMATLLMASGVALAFNVIQCKAGAGYCAGTDQSDLIKGTSKGDYIYGYGAPDSLYGYGGADSLIGDSVSGEGRNDKLFGGDGSDRLYSDPGDDRLEGGGGGDDYVFYDYTTCCYGRTQDVSWGSDTVVDANANVDNKVSFTRVKADLVIRLNSDSGPRPEVQAGTNTINWDGNVIDDVVNSGYGDDIIIGNGAPNYIYSNYGASQVRGGGGDDIIDVDDGDGNDTVYCGTDSQRPGEKDTVRHDAGDTVAADCETRIK